MADFDWSHHQTAEDLEAFRSFRFRAEWRPLLLQYLGFAPGMNLLEVACGPGTFAPYLAAGIAPGRVVGLDLDARFIDRARTKAADSGMTNLEYVVGDAYDLPFPDDQFDGVTSFTGVGVLSDPERAIGEMGAAAGAEPAEAPAGRAFRPLPGPARVHGGRPEPPRSPDRGPLPVAGGAPALGLPGRLHPGDGGAEGGLTARLAGDSGWRG